ncbi:MAG: polymer-forming cytoskeletal protein [Candidatus Omnitrophica bacterium]|nr:polymer-forming cytoskeletal protein [Candidatus Omnitrophota bacterium]
MLGKPNRPAETNAADRVLEVTASMQGTLAFKDPVNLRISGKFEGTLDTLGSLTIGEKAQVDAQITGEMVTVAGRVQGKIIARQSLRLVAPAHLSGEVWTPRLVVEEGAVLDGICRMQEAAAASTSRWLSEEEVAQYLEIEPKVVRQWASQGRIPASREGEAWRFEKSRLDQWIATERSR